MIATKSGPKVRKSRAKVPEHLIYEIIDGQPIHYRGYREVMSGQKTFSEIMGSSGLQSLIVTYLIILLGKSLDDSKYTILSSESGLHLDKHNNLAGDILIFDNEYLTIDKIDEHYVDVCPKIAIEVDIRADPADMGNGNYIFKKTQKLLDFGVEKAIWVTTQAKKVTVATPGSPWQVLDWNEDIEVLNGITCNVGQYLKTRGSTFA
ncbi:Uma2 family endonuclease [Persicitalea sp.]|uniref:Uma2 family endonuclease n=1 Tax=Persicitalea sp. TaxID=3100273 RepID=UPI0035934066